MNPLYSINKPDFVFLHAPSVFDFREKSILFGPISDVVPSTPVFEMYPIGFVSMAEYLHRAGFKVAIINLAYRMLQDKNFQPAKLIEQLQPLAFGIDLHWLPHAHGSLEVAKICKQLHPQIPVIFGGLSSTYFHHQLVKYPQVDFVIRGDSTEEPLLRLMRTIKYHGEYRSVPNLTWKNIQGEVKVNQFSHVPEQLDDFSNNYSFMFSNATKYVDPISCTAIHDWWRYPITVVMTCRGCSQDCGICGGSNFGLAHYANRPCPAFRPVQTVVADVAQTSHFSQAPIFIVGDLLQPGHQYAQTFFQGIKKIGLKNHLVTEFFSVVPEDHYRLVASSVENFDFEISPESHDQNVRAHSGKHYSNQELENNIKWALKHGASKYDIFFMIGMPGQDIVSVRKTIDYCEHLMDRFGPKVFPFIAPLAPFIDPGSLIYENAEFYGYKILFKDLEDYRQHLLAPSWKYMLNYESKWLSRDELVNSTYEAALRLNDLKLKHNLIDSATHSRVSNSINKGIGLQRQIDEIQKIVDLKERQAALDQLKIDMNTSSISSVCDTEEIKWPTQGGLRYFNIFKTLITDIFNQKNGR